jgi:medium-chain acyl-[acyl-carrier-protein] hydrolase
LPGRENRRNERLLEDFDAIVDAAEAMVRPYLDRPAALFGHSMGSWVAFEVTRRISTDVAQRPRHLFVSGRRAPQLGNVLSPIHGLPDDELIGEIQHRYGGIPDAVLKEPELLAITLPILRADLAALHSYRYSAQARLDCRISCFAGREDRLLSQDDLEAWRSQTSAGFDLERYPGGHFYLTGPSASTLLGRIGAMLEMA